jgi:hypothetical protein
MKIATENQKIKGYTLVNPNRYTSSQNINQLVRGKPQIFGTLYHFCITHKKTTKTK